MTGPRRAHPRRRGDGQVRSPDSSRSLGSPPQARGRPDAVRQRDPLSRRAHPRRRGDGKAFVDRARPKHGAHPRRRGDGSAGLARPPFRGRAHPRRRGDGTHSLRNTTHKLGSPPQARGRPVVRRRRAAPCGLTPAGAGTAHFVRRSDADAGAHPRRRGDGDCPCGFVGVAGAHPRRRGDGRLDRVAREGRQGSPPQARGRPKVDYTRARWQGLTPAGAGTAGSPATASPPPWAHPRRRGDGSSGTRRGWPSGGLTPAGAGTAECDSAATVPDDGGLTPAGAGTAWMRAAECAGIEGSPPQARGRHRRRRPVHRQGGGSPPQARGRLVRKSRRKCTPWLTPQARGRREGSFRGAWGMGAHPRRRGDGRRLLLLLRKGTGSPPQARGRHAGHGVGR